MAMSTVIQPEKKEAKPSALENAVKGLGIAVTLGNTAFKAADVFKSAGDAAKSVSKSPLMNGSTVEVNARKLGPQAGRLSPTNPLGR